MHLQWVEKQVSNLGKLMSNIRLKESLQTQQLPNLFLPPARLGRCRRIPRRPRRIALWVAPWCSSLSLPASPPSISSPAMETENVRLISKLSAQIRRCDYEMGVTCGHLGNERILWTGYVDISYWKELTGSNWCCECSCSNWFMCWYQLWRCQQVLVLVLLLKP